MSEASIPETPSYVVPEMLPTEELTKFCEGKTFLIYGAAPGSSRNIGSELARTALVNGAANVVLFDIRRENLDEYAEKLNEQFGDRVHAFHGDITKKDDVRAATEFTASLGDGYLDAMVDCVGVFLIGLPKDITLEHVEKATTGFVGAALSTHAAWEQMLKQGKHPDPNRKFNIGVAGSIAQYYNQDGVALYSATMKAEAAMIEQLNFDSNIEGRDDIEALEGILGFSETSSFADTAPVTPGVDIGDITKLFKHISVDPAKVAEAILKAMARGKEKEHYPIYAKGVKFAGPIINFISKHITKGTFIPLMNSAVNKQRKKK